MPVSYPAGADFLTPLRCLGLCLWVCRVSVLSLGAGFFAFSQLRQTHALFLDLHATSAITVAHWATFYVSVLVFWMLPVQLGARVMLNAAKHRIPGNDTRWYHLLDAHLPWVLGLLCMVAVLIGQMNALELLPDGAQQTTLTKWATKQVNVLQWVTIALGAIWLLTWAVLNPLFFRLGDRLGWLDNRLIRSIAERYLANDSDAPAHAVPAGQRAAWAAVSLLLLLSMSVWLVLVKPLEINAPVQRAPLLVLALGNIVPILTICVFCGQRWRLPIMTMFVLALTFMANFLPNLHSMRSQFDPSEPQASTAGPAATEEDVARKFGARQVLLKEAVDKWTKANCPSQPADQPQGADPAPGAAQPQGTDQQKKCTVRPIVIAAEGGASRAAFFTASVLAHLEDLSVPKEGGDPTFTKQVFAISTVSGSSLGAAVFAAMSEELATRKTKLPDTKEDRLAALWFKNLKRVADAPRAKGLKRVADALGTADTEPIAAKTRKDAVQMILAEDFFSPAAAALGRDVWAPWLALFTLGDRAIYLEKAWEKRFAWYFKPRDRAEAKDWQGLDRRFSSFAPEEGRWRPLLLFNGTSVTRGRRIITATLHPSLNKPVSPNPLHGFEPIFGDAYDTYDLMCYGATSISPDPCKCTVLGGPNLEPRIERQRMSRCDIPLSTAVSNSARFPVISPHGDIIGRDKQVVDRIVDGGYFDFSGLVTAQELAQQLRTQDLDPFILFITNDPGFDPDLCNSRKDHKDDPEDQSQTIRRQPKPSQPIEPKPFAMLQYPLFTAIGARVARSVQSTTELRQRMETIKEPSSGEAAGADIISVGGRCHKDKQLEPIPINWWLAAPVQEHLDAEICAPRNRDTFVKLLANVTAGAGSATLLGETEANARIRKQCTGIVAKGLPTR